MYNKKISDEFKKYSLKHLGISSMKMHEYEQFQEKMYDANSNLIVENNLTPMILEERELRVTQMSVFDRLMMDRIIHLFGPVNDNMASIVQAQLLFLDSIETKDITFHLSTGGGSVLSGLGICDIMNYVNSDISTINMGLAASMGSILLSSGTKGKRYSLKHSRVMLHTVSSGAEGKVQDMMISLKEAEKYNEILFDMLSENTGKSKKEILKDSDRDFWLNSEESLKYGLIDKIITKKEK